MTWFQLDPDQSFLWGSSTIWSELHVGDWPLTNQPVEAQIWLTGSGEGLKKELLDANLGKEVTVSSLHTSLQETVQH